MTTQEIIRTCRELDDSRTYDLVICGNGETLADGYWNSDHSCLSESDYSGFLIDAAARLVPHGRVDYRVDSIFQNWHGGKHARAGEIVAGGSTWGYRCGWVCTHEQNPPQWLCDLIDRMNDAMKAEAARLGAEAEAAHAEWLAEQESDD